MKKVFCTIVVISTVLLLFTSCQPTPNKDIVINKNNGNLEEIISSEAIASEQSLVENNMNIISEKWSQTFTIQGLECAIDAEIVLPDKKEFPVYKIRQRALDNQTVQKIVDYFTKNATGMRETTPTKEELELELIQAKRGIYTEIDGVVTWEAYEGQEDDITRLEEQIRSTGEEVFLPVTRDIALPKADTYAMPDGSRVHVEADSKKLNIYPLKYGIVQPESWVIAGDAYPGEPKGTTLKNVKLSKQEAYEIVLSFLDEAGIENMGIAEAEKARLIVDMTYEAVSEGWEIILSRNDGGSVPVYIDNQPSGILYIKSEDYIQRWYPEVMSVYVDETGIKTFDWRYPIEVTEILNQNVLVLSFDEIKERILDYIKFGFSHAVKTYNLSNDQKIEVNKVVLTNVMIPVKDDPDHQMLAPTWLIYYTQQRGAMTISSFIAVNAIDGSSIDLKVRR